MTIRDQLAPLIRSAGLRRTAAMAGISPSSLSAWLNGRSRRRLGDEQLDRLATALGAWWALTCDNASHPTQD